LKEQKNIREQIRQFEKTKFKKKWETTQLLR